MKLTEDTLRKMIQEESRSMKYTQAAQDAYEAIQNGDKREVLMELRSMLHAAGSVMLNGEREINDPRLEEAMDHVEEARLILKEIQRS